MLYAIYVYDSDFHVVDVVAGDGDLLKNKDSVVEGERVNQVKDE